MLNTAPATVSTTRGIAARHGMDPEKSFDKTANKSLLNTAPTTSECIHVDFNFYPLVSIKI